MKMWAWLKFQRYPKEPSLMLGFLLWLVILVSTIFVVWEMTGYIYFFYVEPPNLIKAHWAVLLGVLAAVTGWIITSWINTRNSIKQHTINTLLSSRLSTEYMKNAREVNSTFFGPKFTLYPLTAEEVATRPKHLKLSELNYVLNYLEFISAAVKHGDLDEKLMRLTLRGMLCNFYEVAWEYIRAAQVGNPKSYENLNWLYRYWFDPKLQRPYLQRPPTISSSNTDDLQKPSMKSLQPLLVAGAALALLLLATRGS